MKREEIEGWLRIEHTKSSGGQYQHSWCRQDEARGWSACLTSIVRYLERAHADARKYFHDGLLINLDPLAGRRALPSYPNDMPISALKGFFGEALCGAFAEALEIVGGDRWIVPAFLFRLHNAAEEHLHRLVMEEKVPQSIPGRTGSDFIAVAIEDGKVAKFLSGEAKCHETFNVTKCAGFLKKQGEEGPLPVSLPRLNRILREQGDSSSSAIADAVEEVLLQRRYEDVMKTNLFVYIFANPGVNSYDEARISESLKDDNYGGDAPLHVFEVFIPDGTELVKAAYARAYRGVTADVAI